MSAADVAPFVGALAAALLIVGVYLLLRPMPDAGAAREEREWEEELP